MMLDKQTTMSDEQAVTATAVSTNVYDLGVGLGNLGAGQPVYFEASVAEDFAGLTSLTIDVIASDSADMATPTVINSSGAVTLANLKSGYRFAGAVGMHTLKRYIAFKYTVGGVGTGGTINANFALDLNAHESYPSGYVVQTN